MVDIKTRVQGMDPNVKARDIKKVVGETGNIYKALVIISKRSRQLSSELKNELHNKLEEFATSTETIEEIHENKEQIEISKFYERLPNPTLIALDEYLNGDLEYYTPESRKVEEEEEEEEEIL
jgi:DNA-directed RNA polymerase subunit K/omega